MPDEYKSGVVYQLKGDELQPSQNQPRKYFDDNSLEELAESIKQHGLIQPIVFNITESGEKQIVAGERRFRAAKLAGLEEIPAVYNDGDPEILALIENIQREDLNPLEEAEALLSLKNSKQYTLEQLGEIAGKKKNTISELLKLNELSDTIKEEVRSSSIYPKRELIRIARLDEKQQAVRFEQLKKRVAKDTEDSAGSKERQPKRSTFVKFVETTSKLTERIKEGKLKPSSDDNLDDIEKNLRSLLIEIKRLKKSSTGRTPDTEEQELSTGNTSE